MSQRPAVRFLLIASILALTVFAGGRPVHAGDGPQDAEAILGRLKDLLADRESKIIIVPFPNSRSRILKADGTSDFFLYVERGNLRGTEAMDEFYAALDAGDMVAANDVFVRHSLVSMRISDYGWNGLGVPFVRQDGSGGEVQDRFYRTKEGAFGPSDVTPEDAATYLEYVETILIPVLEGGS